MALPFSKKPMKQDFFKQKYKTSKSYFDYLGDLSNSIFIGTLIEGETKTYCAFDAIEDRSNHFHM